MAKAVKLADIAERLSVSTVTVSKALSGQKGVSEEMREKIKSLAEELGYQQPSARKSQNTGNSYNIGVLIATRYMGLYESFYWQMYQQVATKAVSKGCFTLMEAVGEKEEKNGTVPILINNFRFMEIGAVPATIQEMKGKAGTVTFRQKMTVPAFFSSDIIRPYGNTSQTV